MDFALGKYLPTIDIHAMYSKGTGAISLGIFQLLFIEDGNICEISRAQITAV
jgi:hypothetical protein